MEIINIKDQLPKISKKTSEALKVLRTNIQLSGTDIKTIEFTSTFSNEGKTRTSFCLANNEYKSCSFQTMSFK